MDYDVLIIGGGPAGLTAAIYAGRGNLRVGILEKGNPGGQIYTYDKAGNAELKPHKLEHSLAFMWESRYVFRPTKFALSAPQLQKDYERVWDGFKKQFK